MKSTRHVVTRFILFSGIVLAATTVHAEEFKLYDLVVADFEKLWTEIMAKSPEISAFDDYREETSSTED
jgi:hypothetical protein